MVTTFPGVKSKDLIYSTTSCMGDATDIMINISVTIIITKVDINRYS